MPEKPENSPQDQTPDTSQPHSRDTVSSPPPHPGGAPPPDTPDGRVPSEEPAPQDKPTPRDPAQPDPEADLLAGRYRIRRVLGKGGMGIVYQCHDTVTETEVAVKALHPDVPFTADQIQTIRRNFQLIADLQHPNIAAVRTLDRNAATGELYLIMQFVDGANLHQFRKQQPDEKLSFKQAAPIAQAVASALDEVHAQRVAHCDIKPSNIMMTSHGTVKVLDFGLATTVHTTLSTPKPGKGTTGGTPQYMAPEQWQGHRIDAAADQYALAATLYELLCGRVPFRSAFVTQNPQVMRSAVLNAEPEPIQGLPDHAWKAVLKGLSKNPADRFPTCGDFATAFGAAAPRQSRITKRLALLALGAVLLALLIAGACRALRRNSANSESESNTLGTVSSQEETGAPRAVRPQTKNASAENGTGEAADKATTPQEDQGSSTGAWGTFLKKAPPDTPRPPQEANPRTREAKTVEVELMQEKGARTGTRGTHQTTRSGHRIRIRKYTEEPTDE